MKIWLHVVGLTTLALGAMGAVPACKQKVENDKESPPSAAAALTKPPEVAHPDESQAGPEPKKGMLWIPKGTLTAGTPPGSTPRIADEELPGTPIEMGGFYIDQFPFPNEPGAIATTNVSRDEAAKQCEARGKRLCSELEWERACKGPENVAYEYGPQYRAGACATGIAVEKAASRTNGEYPACKSGFGVMDLHGGVWEWTRSTWEGRKAGEQASGVLRGGNATSGELVGRCANSLARSINTKSATIGFRCCAGPENPAEVKLSLEAKVPFERLPTVRATTAGIAKIPRVLWGSDGPIHTEFFRAWHWRPVADEELVITSGCEKRMIGVEKRCGVVIARIAGSESAKLDAGATEPDDVTIVADFATGPRIPDLIPGDTPTKMRARSIDVRGTFARDFSYVIGKVTVAPEIRP